MQKVLIPCGPLEPFTAVVNDCKVTANVHTLKSFLLEQWNSLHETMGIQDSLQLVDK